MTVRLAQEDGRVCRGVEWKAEVVKGETPVLDLEDPQLLDLIVEADWIGIDARGSRLRRAAAARESAGPPASRAKPSRWGALRRLAWWVAGHLE